jgi:hypothetical protein
MEKGRESGTSSAAYPTSDICSGNWPVLHDGESMLASAVLTRRNIRWPKGQFPLPDSPFLGARDLMERQRKGSTPSVREKISIWQEEWSFLTA